MLNIIGSLCSDTIILFGCPYHLFNVIYEQNRISEPVKTTQPEFSTGSTRILPEPGEKLVGWPWVGYDGLQIGLALA